MFLLPRFFRVVINFVALQFLVTFCNYHPYWMQYHFTIATNILCCNRPICSLQYNMVCGTCNLWVFEIPKFYLKFFIIWNSNLACVENLIRQILSKSFGIPKCHFKISYYDTSQNCNGGSSITTTTRPPLCLFKIQYFVFYRNHDFSYLNINFKLFR